MSNYEFWNELGNIFDAVLAYQKKNIEFNKTFITPWVRLGHVFPQEDSNQKALQSILYTAELNPEDSQIWADLGDAFHKTGNFGEAVEAYGKAIELDPAAAWPKSNLALTLEAQGKYQEATLLYQESLERFLDDRDKAITWNRLGNTYRKLGDFENAVGAFLRADELDAKISRYRDTVIETLEPDSMEEYFQGIPDPAANRVTPDPISASNALAAKQEEPEDVRSFSTNFPFDVEGQLDFTARASGSEKSMFLEEGMETATLNAANSELEPTAMKTNPSQNVSGEGIAHPDILGANPNEFPIQDPVSKFKAMEEAAPVNFIGPSESQEPAIDKQLDDNIAYEEYLKDFVEPGRINGDEPTEQSAKSKPVSEIRGSDDAKIEFDTQNANVWNELGNVYFSSGAYDDAIVAYRQAIELDPQFAWAYSNLALAYVQKGRFDEAILLYERSIELFKNAKDKAVTWNRLGNLYRRQQNYDNAIEAYQTADEIDPDNISLWLRSNFSLLGNILKEEPAYIS